MGIWNIWLWGLFGCAALGALLACGIYVERLLGRTWFDPAWMAARHERLLNDPLYEENWEKWA